MFHAFSPNGRSKNTFHYLQVACRPGTYRNSMRLAALQLSTGRDRTRNSYGRGAVDARVSQSRLPSNAKYAVSLHYPGLPKMGGNMLTYTSKKKDAIMSAQNMAGQ